MRITHAIFLIPGLLCLYVSMTCTLIPDFLKVEINRKATQHNIVDDDHLIHITREAFRPPENHKLKVGNSERQQGIKQYTSEDIFKDIHVPAYTRGIYITNSVARSKERIRYFIRQAHTYRLNTFVIDVQKRMISQEIIKMIVNAKIFPVARIVVVEGGLREKKFSKRHTRKIIQLIEDVAAQGFKEAQLDYIRYADIEKLLTLSLSYKYNVIRSFLRAAKQAADHNNISLSADLFGRITLNQHDHIGQRLEIFGQYTQTIYPMLYPSHYTHDQTRMSNPYTTVHEGVTKSKARLPNHRIVAYIQGFNLKVRTSHLSFVNYIKAQIKACDDSFSDGWIIWNARNDYQSSFQAIEQYTQEKIASKNRDTNSL